MDVMRVSRPAPLDANPNQDMDRLMAELASFEVCAERTMQEWLPNGASLSVK